MRTPIRSLSLLAAAGALFAAGAAHAGDHAHWSYKGESGPSHWGETCKTGHEQSPIDIRGAKKSGELPAIGFGYAAGAAEVVNNGHTIQVNLPEGGKVQLASGEYKLLQFHFHTPSEEKIKGQAYPLVAHLVHKNDAGELAVVAVLFREGKENAALGKVFAAMPKEEGAKAPLDGGFDAAALLPKTQAYWAFKGSLTTPPCSEGVKWQVLQTPVEVSKAQLAAFRKLYPMNARPVQPLHGRVVVTAN
jgi:carbonic anhydrase